MHTNQYYKNAALSRLRDNWSPALVATIIFMLIYMLVGSGNMAQVGEYGISLPMGAPAMWPGVGLILTLFVLIPASVGYANATRLMYETGDTDVPRNFWRMSTDGYLHKVAGMFFMGVKLFLWTLLFIVPGIIMSFAYALTPYILEDNPELSAWEASSRSREMMRGHKFELFWLWLSFIGWMILSLLTFGIGFFWLIPYMQLSFAAFYNDLKGGVAGPSGLDF